MRPHCTHLHPCKLAKFAPNTQPVSGEMKLVLKHRQRRSELTVGADDTLRVLARRIVAELGTELDANALTLVSASVRGCKPHQQPDTTVKDAGVLSHGHYSAAVLRE